jgi:large subunit ribosomal protein L28
MAKRCRLSGKGVLTGNNVSHAHNKTRRRFLPNLQETTVMSQALDEKVRLRISMQALRSIDHRGGIDAYLLASRDVDLDPQLRRLKKRIRRAATASAG